MSKKIYCLYSDKNETELLAMAYNLKQRKEITLEYSKGQWFSYECDETDENVFYEDTKKEVRTKFPKVAIPRDLKGNIIIEKKEDEKYKFDAGGEDLRIS